MCFECFKRVVVTAFGDIPESNRFVVPTCTCQHFAIRMKSYMVNAIYMSIERIKLPTCLHIPETDKTIITQGAVFTSAREYLAIRTECHTISFICMPFKHSQALTCSDIPKGDGSVCLRDSKYCAIQRAKCDTIHPTLMSL